MVSIKKKIENIKAWNKITNMPNAAAWMNIVEGVMKFATDVQQNQQPMMTQICAINMGVEELPNQLDIVSLWAAVGEQNPIVRLRQLKAQVEQLRGLLIQAQGHIPAVEKTLNLNIKIVLDCTQ